MLEREDVGLIRDYLLGATDDATADALDERALLDPEFLEHVALVEDDLIEVRARDDSRGGAASCRSLPWHS
jgi:hypothetical protein